MDMNAYFPFDPFDLPQSRKWIDGIYRVWADVAIGGDDEEEDEDEDSSAEDDEDEDEAEEEVEGSPRMGLGIPTVVGSAEEEREEA